MSISFASGISISPLPGGGISALDLVQALRVTCGLGTSRNEATKSFAKLRKSNDELEGVGKALGAGPVLLTMEHINAVIDSKTYNTIAVDFKYQHLDSLASMLPGDQEQQPLPPYFTDGLTHVTGNPISGRFSAKAASYPDFLQFMAKMEQLEGVHFNSDSRHEQLGGALLKLTYSCHFGGKAKWEERKGRAEMKPEDFKRPASAGHSVKCNCPANITVFVPVPYARQLGLVKSGLEAGSSNRVTDTIINIKMELGHHGHTPNSQNDLFTLPTDQRFVVT